MTGPRVEHGPHIDEGDLIRLLDGECAPDERALFSAHIDACPECQSSADSLREASTVFSASMLELDGTDRASPKPALVIGKRYSRARIRLAIFSSPTLRAAAVLALIILVFAATPARAWLAQGWEALKTFVTSEPQEQPVIPDTSEVPPVVMSSILRFTPSGSQFRLEFTEWQTGGTLNLMLDSVTTASAGILGEESDDEMILLPDGLRVRNSDASTTSYEVRLPLTLSIVEVMIEGGTVLRLDLQSQDDALSRELSLSRQSEN